VGLYRAAVDRLSQETGCIQNPDTVISILNDTEKVFPTPSRDLRSHMHYQTTGELSEIVHDPSLLTPHKICHLHTLIMQHSRFAEVEDKGLKLQYLIRAGQYRVLYSTTTLQECEKELVAFAAPTRISDEMVKFVIFLRYFPHSTSITQHCSYLL
jgi:hypothetical protein